MISPNIFFAFSRLISYQIELIILIKDQRKIKNLEFFWEISRLET